MEYIVRYGQNLMDIAIQELGSIEGLLTLAIDNNLSITSEIALGQVLLVDTTKITNKKVVEYYQNNRVIVATASNTNFAPPPVPTFDETNLVFDFDSQATAKQTLRDGIYLESYEDRGLNFAQVTASKQPTVTSEGILFDGVNDLLTVVAPVAYPEVWIVLKNASGGTFPTFQCAFSASSGLLADPRFSMLGYVSTSELFAGQVDNNRVNNVVTDDFTSLDEFKIWSAERATYNKDNFTIGATNGVVGGAQFWNGTIKRLLIFDTVLSEERKTALQAYLAYTYNL